MVPAALSLLSAALVVLGFWPAMESIRGRVSFVPTTCTVLDRGSSGVPLSGQADAIADDIAEPMAALRYNVGKDVRISTGFNIRGSARTAWTEGAYRGVNIGADYPCWYDPEQPQRVVLRRGPSAAAMLTLVPIGTFLVCLRWLRRAWRRTD
jgi:hypothetical protein